MDYFFPRFFFFNVNMFEINYGDEMTVSAPTDLQRWARIVSQDGRLGFLLDAPWLGQRYVPWSKAVQRAIIGTLQATAFSYFKARRIRGRRKGVQLAVVRLARTWGSFDLTHFIFCFFFSK